MPRAVTYASVCSGIGTDAVAWHPLGWKSVFFSEIEPFPSAVLQHHYPEVPNLGDFTQIQSDAGPIDLLAGGTPCQAFSVAGKRAGLDDPRGNLTLEFLALARRLRPRWLVWENVPGVLSIDGGRTFGTFLGLMGELGYGWAYRVLDAQHFGVPQRRRRVFVVGYFGDWRPAAAVLFERYCLSGYPTPSRETRQGATHSVAPSLTGSGRGVERTGESRGQDPVVAVCPTLRSGGNQTGGDRPPGSDVDTCDSLVVTHSLRADGFDASEDGTGRGTPLVPCAFINQCGAESGDISSTLKLGCHSALPMIAFSCKDHGADAGDTAPTLRAMEFDGSHANGGGQVAVVGVGVGEVSGTLRSDPGSGFRSDGSNVGAIAIHGMAVRRLTPVECEKLQGLPPGYTNVPYRGKPAADGPRYKAIGNGWAVPVVRWIGERINAVEQILEHGEGR